MTWVSTVSPRALDRVMEEAVPGASVFPTLTRPGATQKGNGELDDWLGGWLLIEDGTAKSPA
jgi:hypothetical protein